MTRLYLAGLILALSYVVVTPVWAHTTETDGNISATLHINPGDDPVYDEPAELIFEFNDKDGRFNIAGCECTVIITEAGKELYNEALVPYNQNLSSLHGRLAFIFPAPDVYQVVVTGKPQAGQQFQAFSLTYNVRVAREPSRLVRLTPHFLHLGAGGVFGAVVVGLMVFNHFKKPA